MKIFLFNIICNRQGETNLDTLIFKILFIYFLIILKNWNSNFFFVLSQILKIIFKDIK